MENYTVFLSTIFPTLLPFILIMDFFMLGRVIHWLGQRTWGATTARGLAFCGTYKRGNTGGLETRKK